GFFEYLAHLAVGAVAIIRKDIDHNSDAAGAEAFVGDFIIGDAFELAGAFLDGAVDVFLRHRHAAGRVDRHAHAHIHHGVAAAVLGRDHDGAAELAPQPATLGVNGAFFVLNVRPMGMPGHASSLQTLAA